ADTALYVLCVEAVDVAAIDHEIMRDCVERLLLGASFAEADHIVDLFSRAARHKLDALETIVMRAGRGCDYGCGVGRLQFREQRGLRRINADTVFQFVNARALNDDLTRSAFLWQDEAAGERHSSLDNDRVAVVGGVERRLQAVTRADVDDAFAV